MNTLITLSKSSIMTSMKVLEITLTVATGSLLLVAYSTYSISGDVFNRYHLNTLEVILTVVAIMTIIGLDIIAYIIKHATDDDLTLTITDIQVLKTIKIVEKAIMILMILALAKSLSTIIIILAITLISLTFGRYTYKVFSNK